MIHTAHIALGSNLGNPQWHVTSALTELNQLTGTTVTTVSNWYRSKPMGPQNQPDYINGAAVLQTSLTPDELLTSLQAIENAHGRDRQQHWGPRTLDLDILLYDKLRIDKLNLQIPHPGITQRAFVLLPLSDLDPNLIFPDGITLASCLESCSSEGIVRLSSGDLCGITG